MANLEQALQSRRAELGKKRANHVGEALGMVGAIRRKMEELEKRLRMDGEAKGTLDLHFEHAAAAVSEVMTLATRLNSINSAGQERASLEELADIFKTETQEEAPITGEAGPVEIPDLETEEPKPEAPTKKGGKAK